MSSFRKFQEIRRKFDNNLGKQSVNDLDDHSFPNFH